jgi:hypothetical protein
LWQVLNWSWELWFKSNWDCRVPFRPRILVIFIDIFHLSINFLVGIPTWDTISVRPMVKVINGIGVGISPKDTKIVSCPILLFFPVGIVLMWAEDSRGVLWVWLTVNWD